MNKNHQFMALAMFALIQTGAFLSGETICRLDAPVSRESGVSDSAVTFQVLPSPNDILSDCKITPHSLFSSFASARSL